MSRVIGKQDFRWGITQVHRQIPYVEGKGEVYSALSSVDGFDIETSHLVPAKGPAKVVDGGGTAPVVGHCRSCGVNIYTDSAKDIYVDRNMESRYDYMHGVAIGNMISHDRGVITPTSEGLMYTEIGEISSYGHVWPTPLYTRPLGAMSHCDVLSGYAPTVSMSSWPGVQMAGSGASLWVKGSNVTSATEGNDKVVFSYGAAVVPGDTIGSCEVTLDTSTVKWILLDLALTGDNQKYDTTGFFSNDPTMLTSGYVLRLENDGGTEYREYRIPRVQTLGTVNRFLIYTGSIGLDVKAVKITTDTLYLPGDGRTLTLYTGPSTWAGWSTPGNWMLPDVSWKASPLYETLSGTTTTTANTDTSQTELVTDGSFPVSTSAWALTGKAPSGWSLSGTGAVIQGDGIYKSPPARLEIDGKLLNWDMSPCIDLGVSSNISVTPGMQYQLEWYDYGESWYMYNVALYMDSAPITGSTWNDFANVERMSLASMQTYADVVNDPYMTLEGTPPNIPWFSPVDKSWTTPKRVIVTIPAGVTNIRVAFSNRPSIKYLNNLSIDNVSMKLLPVNNVGAAYFMQTMTESGDNMTPDLPRVRYVSSMAYKTNRLDGAGWKLMVSNPSNPSSTNDVADPWRVPTVTNVAVNKINTYYAYYIAGVMIYRSFKYPDVGEWEPYEFVGGIQAQSGDYVDNLSPDSYPTTFAGKAVDSQPELYADYPSTAKYVMQSAGRVYAGYLDNGSRKTAIQVSGYEKPWAFTTTYDDNTPWTAGTELDGYAITGTEIRALAMRADEKIVFLDTEVFSLRGSSPSQGYQFTKVAGVGCISHNTVVDCNGAIIWSDGRDFFVYVGAEAAVNISRNKIPEIDWTAPHCATYVNGHYLCYARDAVLGVHKLFMYTLQDNAWSVHTYVAPSGTASLWHMWAIDTTGTLWTLFAGNTISSPYVSGTYWEIAPAGYDSHVSRIILDMRTPAETNVNVTLTWDGAAVGTKTFAFVAKSNQTRYVIPCNINANNVKVSVSQSGDPATIYFIGMEVDEVATR